MEYMDIITSLITLTILEIILGVDNLIFIAIITNRLPKKRQPAARRLGLFMAWFTRLILLASVVWIIGLTKPLFSLFDQVFSGRDLLLILGGLFLIAKATKEIHSEVESHEGVTVKKKYAVFWMVVTQVAFLDIIFSLDSVMTAIGLTPHYWIMATAISITILLMIFMSEPLSRFVHNHASIRMLALSFLLLIGMILIADGFQFHIPRGYVYFALGYSLFVEFLNSMRKKKKGVRS